MKFLYETHLHTSEGSGCGRNSAAEQVQAYKRRGYQGIIVTDHFINGFSTCPRYHDMTWEDKMAYVVAGYMSAKEEGDRIGLDVFQGWEFTIRGSDFLTYGLDWDFLLAHPGLHKLDVAEYSEVVRKNGGFLAQAHPYRKAPYIEYQFPVGVPYIDAVEIYNASDTKQSNEKARAFAKKHDLPVQAGSDSHGTDGGIISGIRLEKRAENIQDIIEAIKARKVGLII